MQIKKKMKRSISLWIIHRFIGSHCSVRSSVALWGERSSASAFVLQNSTNCIGRDRERRWSLSISTWPRLQERRSMECSPSITCVCVGTKCIRTTLRCFASMPPNHYIDYMDNILQKKRFDGGEFASRSVNRPRNKSSECIWSDDNAKVRQQVLQILQKFEYH